MGSSVESLNLKLEESGGKVQLAELIRFQEIAVPHWPNP